MQATSPNPMSQEVEGAAPPVNMLASKEVEVAQSNVSTKKAVALLGGVAVVAGVAFAGGYFANDSSSESTNVSGTATPIEASTVTVSFLSDQEVSGEILCNTGSAVEAFYWRSSASEISFQSVNAKGMSETEQAAFNGFAGVQLAADNVNLDLGLSSFTGEESVVIEETGIDATVQSQLQSMSSGAVGECMAQLSVGLGELGYIGKENPAMLPIMQLGFVMMRNEQNNIKAGRSMESTWNLEDLNNRLYPERVERELQGCNTNEWYRLGDGRCDTEFNNAECNFDNGDCCSKTCKDFASLWENSESPEDNEGIRHPVYGCDVNDDATCVPQCTASDQGRLGDGRCDSDLNTEACGFDLGDCCETTCNDNAEFDCESNGYNCISGAAGWGQRDYCGNDSFGMCGGGSDCIKSLCGDCYVHHECQEHDQFCSCDGTFTWGCINVFRDWCD